MSNSKENIFQLFSLTIKNKITLSVFSIILLQSVFYLTFDVDPLSKFLLLLYISIFALLLYRDKYRNKNENRSITCSNFNSIFILNSVCVMLSLYLKVPTILVIISPLLHVILTSIFLRYVKFSDAEFQRQEAFFITLLSFAVLLPDRSFNPFPTMPHLMFIYISILSILLYYLYYRANSKKQKFKYTFSDMFGQMFASFLFAFLLVMPVLMSGFMVNMVMFDETSYSYRFFNNFSDSIPYFYAAFIASFYLLFVVVRMNEVFFKTEKNLKSLSKIEWVRIPVRIIETILVLLFILLIILAIIAYVNGA
ncbi:TPA: hypothetical protein DCR49_06630 [Candidatus Delongbacteria bacterium]|nr:MAG: hypothetical protein A2Y39_06410 [Candidatus Delongbacteria bacterium GWF2_40_14]HAQ61660.1 hypothetical protein [Candidatus Delongbacteria bacterium]